MPKPLSQEIREKIIYHKKTGAKNEEKEKWLRVSRTSVKRIWKQYKYEKTIEVKKYKSGRKPAFCEKKMEKIKTKIAEQPDITIEELVDLFNLQISISALSRKLTKLELTFKKRRFSQKSNSARMYNGFGESG